MSHVTRPINLSAEALVFQYSKNPLLAAILQKMALNTNLPKTYFVNANLNNISNANLNKISQIPRLNSAGKDVSKKIVAVRRQSVCCGQLLKVELSQTNSYSGVSQ